MIAKIERDSSLPREARWGWIILFVLCGFLILNGIGWIFMGSSLATFEQDTGVPLEQFREDYPGVARSIATNARQVAIWFIAVGSLAMSVVWQGYRHGARWAWNTLWILAAAPAAVGLNVLAGGESSYGIMIIGLGGVALAGLLLARRGLPAE